MKIIILIFGYLVGNVYSQPQVNLPPSNTTNTTITNPNNSTNNSTTPSNACDPYYQVCPNSDCTPAALTGNVFMTTPIKDDYYYLNSNVNITWRYNENTDKRFPRNNVTLYYKGPSDTGYSTINAIGPRNTTYIWRLPSNILPGTWEVVVVPDDVSNYDTKIGHPSSCLHDGFPLPGLVLFQILPNPSVADNSADNFAPNGQNSASIQSKTMFAALLAALFFIFV